MATSTDACESASEDVDIIRYSSRPANESTRGVGLHSWRTNRFAGGTSTRGVRLAARVTSAGSLVFEGMSLDRRGQNGQCGWVLTLNENVELVRRVSRVEHLPV